MKNLLDQVKHWAKISPDKIMVIDGDVTMTYAEVFDRARRFAGGLVKLRIKKTSRVAAIIYNNYRYYDLYYGVSAGGYVLVPLNFRLADPESAYQINDSGTQIVIMGPEFEEIISRIKSSLKTVKHFVYTGEKSPFVGALLKSCGKQIAYFKTPKSIDFVNSLPKSGAGKILKRTLKDNYWKSNDRFVH